MSRDKQLHVSHCNLVHVSTFKYRNGERILKIFDHHLHMNNIPHNFLHDLEIHAIDITFCSRYYLEHLVSNDFQFYFTRHISPTILFDEIQHLHGPPANNHYYREQEGGHGLFGNTGPMYTERGDYAGLHFSKCNLLCVRRYQTKQDPFVIKYFYLKCRNRHGLSRHMRIWVCAVV